MFVSLRDNCQPLASYFKYFQKGKTMGIGESLKEKKGCVFFFILFRFADTISSEKELKGLNLSCPHFPFMSYTYSSSIGIYFFFRK